MLPLSSPNILMNGASAVQETNLKSIETKRIRPHVLPDVFLLPRQNSTSTPMTPIHVDAVDWPQCTDQGGCPSRAAVSQFHIRLLAACTTSRETSFLLPYILQPSRPIANCPRIMRDTRVVDNCGNPMHIHLVGSSRTAYRLLYDSRSPDQWQVDFRISRSLHYVVTSYLSNTFPPRYVLTCSQG